MSAYTTRTMTRRKALSMLQEAINDPATSNEILGDMLDGLLRPYLYNALVIPDYVKTDDVEDLPDERE